MSDEAHFQLSGVVNKQNCRYWSLQNPNELHEKSLHSERVTVRCLVSSQEVNGPFFFEDNEGEATTVTAARYMHMTETFFRNQLPRFPSVTWFQQDGATAHTARISTNTLKHPFPNCLIHERRPHLACKISWFIGMWFFLVGIRVWCMHIAHRILKHWRPTSAIQSATFRWWWTVCSLHCLLGLPMWDVDTCWDNHNNKCPSLTRFIVPEKGCIGTAMCVGQMQANEVWLGSCWSVCWVRGGAVEIFAALSLRWRPVTGCRPGDAAVAELPHNSDSSTVSDRWSRLAALLLSCRKRNCGRLWL
jgi:hypothetical protein